MKTYVVMSVTAVCLALGFGYGYSQAEQSQQAEGGWLVGASNDTERFRRLEQYLGGFDKPMWEVGERYRMIYEALKLENYDLALYHWDKIRAAVQSGYLTRPEHKANSDRLLIGRNWTAVNNAFSSRERKQAWYGFGLARSVCLTCHVTENVGFLNNQSLFRDLEPLERIE